MSFDNLHASIMALPHTGSGGFEGLVRDLLAEITGQRFRLMKSGPQGGVDVVGDPGGSSITVGLEGKHYAVSTPLPLDALKSKVRDAAVSFPELDLWILAATRPVPGGDAIELARVGDSLGIDVLVLDWNDEVATPAALAILCAAAPNATEMQLGASDDLTADLDAIRRHHRFAGERQRLVERLTSPAVGYAATRAAMATWLRRQMDDLDAARLAFDSYANLRQANARRITRPKVDAVLSAWWRTQADRLGAVLGEEGVGKTWAVLGWWLDASEADPQFPLTVVIPARDVVGRDGPALVARALHQATGVRDVAFWTRRLARWTHIEAPKPFLLAVIDGLNQRWAFSEWTELALSLRVGDWAGKVALAVTCRPDHWRHRLREMDDLTPLPVTIPVSGFDDSELDGLLHAYGLPRDEFGKDVLELMRTPRLCHLAIARREDLQDSGDVTSERLIYEDWRHRSHAARKALSHEEFQTFVAGLGRSMLEARGEPSSLSRAELLDRLSADSGETPQAFEGVLSEIVDGGWAEPTGKPHRFRVRQGRTPHLLGLALADEVAGISTEEETADRIAEGLEPLQGADASVSILRSAVTFALLDPSVGDTPRRALLKAWIGSQNFGGVDFEKLWRLIGCAPNLFMDVVEDVWFGERFGRHEDEVFVKGLGNAWRWPNVAHAIEERLVTWLSRYWLDPLEGEVLNQVLDDASATERRSATQARAAAWARETRSAGSDIKLQLVEPLGQAWGAHRAIALMSWLPRAPLIRALEAWAVTRALMGSMRQTDAVGWLLRWNPYDATDADTAVIALARTMIGRGGEVHRAAAKALLAALASPPARTLHDAEFGEAATSSRRVLDTVRRRSDGILDWNVDEALAWGRCRNAPLEATYGLAEHAVDPTTQLPPPLVRCLEDLAGRLSDEQLWAPSSASAAETGGFETGRLALARWTPEVRAALERRRFGLAMDGALADERARDLSPAPEPATARAFGLSDDLPFRLLVLPNDQLEPWRRLAALDRTAAVSPEDLHSQLQSAALAGLPAEDQVDILAELPEGVGTGEDRARILSTPDATVFPALAGRLDPAAASSDLRRWLDYLLAVDLAHMPPGWEPLKPLLAHPDLEVRVRALQVALKAEDLRLAGHLDEQGWRDLSTLDRRERAYGSLLLTRAPRAASDASIAKRVHPEALGALAERQPHQPAYLEGFAAHVASEMDFLFHAKSRSYPRALLSHTEGWARLAAERPALLRSWLEPLLSDARMISPGQLLFAETFPLLDALQTLGTIDPDLAAAMIEKGLDQQRQSVIKAGSLMPLVFKLASPQGDRLRDTILDEANDDAKLFAVARDAQKHGQLGWLRACIDRDLGASAGLIARGMMLAGFLEQSPEADALWTGRLAVAPATGWLSEVHATAARHYLRNAWARHWYGQFEQTNSDDAAFSAHELMVATADGRIVLGNRRPVGERLDAWTWRKRAHWRLAWPRVLDAISARAEKLKKVFLGGKPPESAQRPSLH